MAHIDRVLNVHRLDGRELRLAAAPEDILIVVTGGAVVPGWAGGSTPVISAF